MSCLFKCSKDPHGKTGCISPPYAIKGIKYALDQTQELIDHDKCECNHGHKS